MQKWILRTFEKFPERNALGTFNFDKQAYDFISYKVLKIK
jgi:hypothetical protein